MNFGKISMASIAEASKLIEIRRAITSRTKMIIVNTPHNPVGKVFTQAELEGIAALAEEFNLLVMADEVVSYFVGSP